ncbi:MAG: DHH family phosphoesterase [Halanaerobiales bacterium]|nr:DHH family phosphoesterase [Halanaerobiales bacterium]
MHKVYSLKSLDFIVHKNKEVGIANDKEMNKALDSDLVIVPDAGSSQYKKHKRLKDNGIDVIVLDHHHTDKESEHAIVVNNQISPEYNNKALSGAGVVFKFCQVLDDITGSNYAKDLVDLAALGIASDNMDMRNRDNIVIIRRGIYLMNQQDKGNKFIKALIDKKSYSLGDKVYPIDIMFYIAPLINAVIRLGTKDEKEMMFEAFIRGGSKVVGSGRNNKGQMVFIEGEMARIAGNIKRRQRKKETKGMEKLSQIVEKNQKDNKIIILDATNIISNSMTGLVANKIQSKFGKPTLILIKNESDGLYYGSGRCPSGTELDDFRKYLNNTGLVEYAEGHASAFGICIKQENINKLIELSNKLLEKYEFKQIYNIDFLVPSQKLDGSYIFKLDEMKHLWGTDLREPLMMVTGMKIDKGNLELIGKKSNIIKIKYQGIEYIMFRAEDKIKEIPDTNSYTVNVIGKPNVNEWRGKVVPQIIMEDCEIKGNDSFVF